MLTPKIKTLEQLHEYLRAAMQLEHATTAEHLIAAPRRAGGTGYINARFEEGHP